MEGNAIQQKKDELARLKLQQAAEEQQLLAELKEKRAKKLDEIAAYVGSHPEDRAGLSEEYSKLLAELRSIREEIVEITEEAETEVEPLTDKEETFVREPVIEEDVAPPIGNEKIDNVTALKILLEQQGINLENLENENFDRLQEIFNLINRLYHQSLEAGLTKPEIKNEALVSFLHEIRDRIMEHLEITGVRENRRIPEEEFEKLREEFSTAGLAWDYPSMYTPEQLVMAKEILQRYEARFPDNGEITERLNNINKYLAPKTEEGVWTEEDEATLNNLLEVIREATERIKINTAKLEEILAAEAEEEEMGTEGKPDLPEGRTPDSMEQKEPPAESKEDRTELEENKAEIERMRQAELENPEVTIEDYIEANKRLTDFGKQKAREAAGLTLELAKQQAVRSFLYFQGKISARDLIMNPPYRYNKEIVDTERIDKYAEEESLYWRQFFDKINTKYDQMLSDLEK